MKLITAGGSTNIGKVLVTVEMDMDEWTEFQARIAESEKRVDPPDCGCTGCMTGFSRPALSYDEYERSKS